MEGINQDYILALIARNLAGEADSLEKAQLKEWIESSIGNREYFERVRNIWDASDKGINPEDINISKALNKVMERMPEITEKRNLWYYWQKIAAVLFLPLLIGSLFWDYHNSQIKLSSNDVVYNEIYAAYGTRSSLILSDSTLVWLNSGSSLKYPIKFNDKNRRVFLKGEAYFEVKSDIRKPFIVQTSTFQVKATGTKFNVLEYDSNLLSEVTLVSGKVFVNELCNISDPQLIAELYPGEHLKYNRDSKTKNISKEDVYRFVAWKDGKLIFRNESLDNVLNKISLMFNVDIELQGKELQNYRYRATFLDESLEEILKLLMLSAPINYKEVKRNPLPDGSFPKKKVIIFPAKLSINSERN